MTLGTLVRRNLSRRKARTALLLIAIAAAFVLYGVLAAMQRNFAASDSLEAESRLVVSNRVGLTQPLPLTYREAIRDMPGAAQTTYRNLAGAFFQEQRNPFLILAVEPETYLSIYPEYQMSGAERAAFLSDRNSLLVGSSLAQRFGWKAGDVVPIGSLRSIQGAGSIAGSYRIAGIFSAKETATGTGLALMHWTRFNESRVVGRDTVGNFLVASADASGNDELIRQIDAYFANSPARTRTSTEQEFSRAMVAQLGNISLMVVSVVAAGFFTILLVVGTSMAAAVRERRKEIGILRSLGFSDFQVAKTIIGEALALAFVGGAIGLLIASSIVKGLRPLQSGAFARMELTPYAVAAAVALIIGLAAVGALVPVIQALRINVTQALSRREG